MAREGCRQILSQLVGWGDGRPGNVPTPGIGKRGGTKGKVTRVSDK